jgi:hypothetical protein
MLSARRTMPFRLGRHGLWVALLLALPAGARADGAGADIGHGRSALPAIDLVQVLTPAKDRPIRAHASFGYGYTEEVLDAGDAHHRSDGQLALSFQPIDEVALAGRFDGRFDAHTGEAGGDEGFVSQASWMARGAVPIDALVSLGAEVALRFPGTSEVGRTFAAISPEARALITLAPPGSSTWLSAALGFRLDRAREGLSDAERLSLSDRVGLGASDANAVLLGLGALRSFGRFALLGEWTWDVQVGGRAAPPLESPMRIALGARFFASRTLQLQALTGVSPSARPAIDASAPLYPIEPRFFLSLGLGLRFGDEPAPAPERAPPPKVQEAPPPAPPPAPTARRVTGRVSDAASQAPIAGAVIEASGASAVSDASGLFQLENMPLDFIELRVRAGGFKDAVVPIGAGGAQAEDLEIQLEADRATALIRGTVSNFQGRVVAGHVHVQPGNVGAVLDADGSFEIEVPAGEYTVLIKASGYGLQQRRVRVERGDVAVIVVQLQAER